MLHGLAQKAFGLSLNLTQLFIAAQMKPNLFTVYKIYVAEKITLWELLS
jgi:hypothetical protein